MNDLREAGLHLGDEIAQLHLQWRRLDSCRATANATHTAGVNRHDAGGLDRDGEWGQWLAVAVAVKGDEVACVCAVSVAHEYHQSALVRIAT